MILTSLNGQLYSGGYQTAVSSVLFASSFLRLGISDYLYNISATSLPSKFLLIESLIPIFLGVPLYELLAYFLEFKIRIVPFLLMLSMNSIIQSLLEFQYYVGNSSLYFYMIIATNVLKLMIPIIAWDILAIDIILSIVFIMNAIIVLFFLRHQIKSSGVNLEIHDLLRFARYNITNNIVKSASNQLDKLLMAGVNIESVYFYSVSRSIFSLGNVFYREPLSQLFLIEGNILSLANAISVQLKRFSIRIILIKIVFLLLALIYFVPSYFWNGELIILGFLASIIFDFSWWVKSFSIKYGVVARATLSIVQFSLLLLLIVINETIFSLGTEELIVCFVGIYMIPACYWLFRIFLEKNDDN